MTEQSSGHDVRRLIGLVLVGASILWMAFSGLCAVWAIGSMLFAGIQGADAWVPIVLVYAIVSGVSLAGGYAVFVLGRTLRR